MGSIAAVTDSDNASDLIDVCVLFLVAPLSAVRCLSKLSFSLTPLLEIEPFVPPIFADGIDGFFNSFSIILDSALFVDDNGLNFSGP